MLYTKINSRHSISNRENLKSQKRNVENYTGLVGVGKIPSAKRGNRNYERKHKYI